jgi:hypothetical protein
MPAQEGKGRLELVTSTAIGVVLAQKPKVMHYDPFRYIDYYFSLYLLIIRLNTHTCIHIIYGLSYMAYNYVMALQNLVHDLKNGIISSR